METLDFKVHLDFKMYIVAGIYDCIVEGRHTPLLRVDTTVQGVAAPKGYDKDGILILNVSPWAVTDYQWTTEAISFKARFNKVEHAIHLPKDSILGIYSSENQQGMIFSRTETTPVEPELSPVIESDIRMLTSAINFCIKEKTTQHLGCSITGHDAHAVAFNVASVESSIEESEQELNEQCADILKDLAARNVYLAESVELVFVISATALRASAPVKVKVTRVNDLQYVVYSEQVQLLIDILNTGDELEEPVKPVTVNKDTNVVPFRR